MAKSELSIPCMQECPVKVLSFIDAVVYQQTHLSGAERQYDAAIAHSALDCVPAVLASPIALLELRHARLRAARLFRGLLTASGIRLAVKVAQVRESSHHMYHSSKCCVLPHSAPIEQVSVHVGIRYEGY